MIPLETAINLFSYKIFSGWLGQPAAKSNVVSPVAMYQNLAMLLRGLEGTDEASVEEFMNIASFSLCMNVHDEVAAKMKSISNSKSDITLKMVAQLFIRSDVAVNADYAGFMVQHYKSDLSKFHQMHNPQEILGSINSWITQESESSLQFNNADDFDNDCRLIAASGFVIKSRWVNMFDASLTTKAPYWQLDGTQKSVDMMHGMMNLSCVDFAALDCCIVSLPMVNDDYELALLLPNKRDGLPDVEQKFKDNGDLFIQLLNLSPETEPVQLNMPKFKVESVSTSQQILQILDASCMTKADANFKKMTNDKISLSAFVHKSIFSIDEKGVCVADQQVQYTKPEVSTPTKTISFDHPFLFTVFSKEDNLAIILGRVNEIPQ